MFNDYSHLIADHPPAKYYGLAIVDTEMSSEFQIAITCFNGPNLFLKFNGIKLQDISDEVFQDEFRQSLGIAAGDVDGNGREEIYIMNADTFGGFKRYGDRFFVKNFQNKNLDLFSDYKNQGLENEYSGRSIAFLDRLGTGLYGAMVANYAGPTKFYEYDQEQASLKEIALEVGLNFSARSRSLLTAPFGENGKGIFVANDQSEHFYFELNEHGQFKECAKKLGFKGMVAENRGSALINYDDQGHQAIVCAYRDHGVEILMPNLNGVQLGTKDRSFEALAKLTDPIRCIVVADFDNDGYEEIFIHNHVQRNRLFKFNNQLQLKEVAIGAASEPFGAGTGAAAVDFDKDGTLELILLHGESVNQKITIYKFDNDNNWFRIEPRTRFGAPARGSVVFLETSDGRKMTRVIDGASGYLCQSEPVAHFGLGQSEPIRAYIIWPDKRRTDLLDLTVNSTKRIIQG